MVVIENYNAAGELIPDLSKVKIRIEDFPAIRNLALKKQNKEES